MSRFELLRDARTALLELLEQRETLSKAVDGIIVVERKSKHG